jgi:hypothetical protein
MWSPAIVFCISATMADSENPGELFIVIVTARSRLCRVIREIAVLAWTLITSDSGT